MAEENNGSVESLIKATESVVDFSGHRAALGAAGYRVASDHPDNCEFLSAPGQSVSISPGENGFEMILIGAAWDNFHARETNLFRRLFRKTRPVAVDLDIGCMYELKDGTRGSIQAFGEKFGSFDNSPFIALSGDERTGVSEGHDECIRVNGNKWDEIERMLLYLYIYDGAPRWSEIKPQIVVDVPGESDLYVTLDAHDDRLRLCAVGELEHVRGGIRLTNRTEYFPGHEEMDRAFGYGLEWVDGQKRPE